MIASRRAEWLRGVLDLCVLAVIDAAGWAYGYEISQRLEAAGLGVVRGGTLYPLLMRLQELDLLTFEWRDSDQGPRRKYYRVTELGRRALTEATVAWDGFARTVGEVLDLDREER